MYFLLLVLSNASINLAKLSYLSVYNGIVAELFEISKTVFECVLISVCPILFWISFIKLLQLFIEKEFSISSIPKITF